MNTVVEIINTAGRAFIEFSLPMFIQAGVLILILLVADAILRRRVRAVFRYWIWMLVLVKLVLPPSLGSPVSVGTWFGDTLDVPTASLLEPEPPLAVEPEIAELPPTISAILAPPDPRIAEPFVQPSAAKPVSPAELAEKRPSIQTPAVSLSSQGLLLVVWAAVVLALVLLLIQRAFFVRGLLGQSEEASRDTLNELENCRRRLGLRRAVALRLSPNATSPAVCGLLRPVILIPQSIAPRLQAHDLQAVLLHELAHVKRGDLWVNLVQTLLQIAYFYNPLLWLANAMIRRTREQAVDETVLVAMGETARQYPEILVNIAKLAFTRRPTLSLRLIGVVESKSALTARIKHILSRPIPKTARLGLLGLLTIVVIAAVLLPMAKGNSLGNWFWGDVLVRIQRDGSVYGRHRTIGRTTIYSQDYTLSVREGERLGIVAELYQVGRPMQTLGCRVFSGSGQPRRLSVSLESRYLSDDKTSTGYTIGVSLEEESLRVNDINVDTPSFFNNIDWGFFPESEIAVKKREGKAYLESANLMRVIVCPNGGDPRSPRIWIPGVDLSWPWSDAYFILVKMLPVNHLDILRVENPSTGDQIPDGTCLPTGASYEQREAIAKEYVLNLKRTLMRDRMPLPKLAAHRYHKQGEPIWFHVTGRNSAGWKPRFDEIYHDPDFNPCFFLIDGREYASRCGFGPFDAMDSSLELQDNLYIRPADLDLPMGKHTVAYGWKDVDVVDPNDPGNPLHFARLTTDPAEFEIVEHVPADYYRQAYEDGWEDILRRGIETPFTDDMHKYGISGPLLALRVDRLPFDTAFAVYVQSEGSEEQQPAGELARVAGAPRLVMGCDHNVKGLDWDSVGNRRWRIILKPSVDVAKKYPPIREFYAREFATDWLSFERSPTFELNRQREKRSRDSRQGYGGAIKADKPIDLDMVGRRWRGQGQAWPLPAGFELGWSPDNGGTLRIDPNSGVRLLWLPEANARLVRVAAESRLRLAELPQSRTTQIVPPKGEPTLIAVLSSEGKVHFVAVSRVNETWANLSWYEDEEATQQLRGQSDMDGSAQAYKGQEERTRIILPEVDRQPVVLNLATGELIPLPAVGPEPEKILKTLREMGKGDFLYDVDLGDRTLIFLRDAKSMPPGEDTGEPSVTGHLIKNLPETILVVTKEGRGYDVTILAADENGCTLKYSPLPAGAFELGPEMPSSAVTPDSKSITTTLPNGVTVSLLGLFKGWSRDNQSWWYPDGTPVPPERSSQFRKNVGNFSPLKPWEQFDYGYLVQFNAVEGMTVWADVDSREQWFGFGSQGDSTRNYNGFAWQSQSQAGRSGVGDIEIASAVGPHKTIEADFAGIQKEGTRLQDENARFLLSVDPGTSSKWAWIDVVSETGDYDVRLRCLDVNGRVLPAYGPQSGRFLADYRAGDLQYRVHGTSSPASVGATTRAAYHFRIGTESTPIKRILLDYRPSAAVTFRNVALQPGQKTDVQTETGSKDLAGASIRQTVLPDVEHKPMMLDLATGTLLPLPQAASPDETWRAIGKLGRGDLVYDSNALILVRDAASDQAHVGPTPPFKAYDIKPPLPVVMTVTTAEGARFEITILAADEEGCTLRYSQIPADRSVSGGAPVEPKFDYGVVTKWEDMPPHVRDEIRRAAEEGGGVVQGNFERFPEQLGVEGKRGFPRGPGGSPLSLYLDSDEARVESGGGAPVEPEKKNTALEPRIAPKADPDAKQKMNELALAISKFADSHEGSLPATLSALSPYLRDPQARAWLDENVTYVGRGSVNRRRGGSIVIAYEKPPQPTGERHVLFLDYHVELAGSQRLRELNIESARQSDARTLEFRIAPKAADLSPDVVERYKQTLAQGGRPVGGDFAWFELRPGIRLVPDQVTCQRDGKTYLLLWDEMSHRMPADGTWGLKQVRESADAVGGAAIEVTLDEQGSLRLRSFAQAHVRQYMAVLVEGRVIAIPFISTSLTLPGGRLPIIGQFTEQESNELIAVLRKDINPQPAPSDADWTDLGESIPADANDDRTIAPAVVLDGIGQDVEGKMFVSLIRDLDATKGREYRFVIHWKDGRVQEPRYRTTVDRFGRRLWEKFTFDTWHNDRQIESIRLQSRPFEGGQSPTTPSPKDEILAAAGVMKTAPTTAAPPGQYALSFDGQGDYLYVPDSESLRKPQALTIEMWIKPKFPEETRKRRPIRDVLAKGAYTGTGRARVQGFGIQMARFDPNANTVMFDRCQTGDAGIVARPTIVTLPADWLHITETFDDYIPSPGQPLVIGRFLIPATDPLCGQIAEVRIWDGTKAPDIRQYADKALTGNEPGLVACWTFEEGSGQIAYDISPNVNHARLGSSVGVDDADPAWVDLRATAATPGALSGRVVDPNGLGVAKAQVALITAKAGVTIDGTLRPARYVGEEKAQIIVTDGRGRFRFENEPNEGFSVIAAHDAGFAIEDSNAFKIDHEVRLAPWGCVEGEVAEGRRSEGDQVLMSGLPNGTWNQHKYECLYEGRYDSQGRFVFSNVPAGWFEVGYLVRTGDSSSSFTSRTPVVVRSGQTTQVKLGGEGRPVVGRFVPPAGYGGAVYFGEGLRALITWRPDPPRPADYDRMTRRQEQDWYNQWRRTPEAQAFYEAIWHNPNWRQYAFRINNDGTFRIEDVIAGKYTLTVYLEKGPGDRGPPEEDLGGYSGTVEVPPISGGKSDEPLELGDLVLRMNEPPLKAGEATPLFEAKTVDGKDVRLADYRGKFVLLSFWQPASNPELERLKELYKAYGASKLQIIGLGGNDTREEVESFVREHKIEWPEVYVGKNWDSGIAKQYRNPVASYIVLVDPEGKIIATWIRGEKLTKTVREAIDAAARP